jgi:hypothetical protein
MPSPSTSRLPTLLALLLAVALLAALIVRVEIQSNDDTYIYFNYARNAVEGRWFAYDSRGVPSEGFTSLLYLVLLVPFEAAGAQMMFAASVANLLALVGIVWLAGRILGEAGALDRRELPAFHIAFLALLVLDGNIATIIGRGLETLLGPLFVLLSLLGATRWLHPDRSDRERARASFQFLASAFAAFLVRPENLAPLGACGLALLALGPASARPSLLRQAAGFVASLAAFHAAKALVFGDVFATAWYRKVRFDGAGVDYVLASAGAYSNEILVLVALTATLRTLGADARRPRARSAALLLGTAAAVSVLVVLPTRPLIGYAFRYLVHASVLLHLGIAWTGVRLAALTLAGASEATRRHALLAGSAVLAAVGVAIAGSHARIDSVGRLADRLDLHARAVRDSEDHHYVVIGRFLRERLPAHEDITVAFGDAGALPYAFRSRFVDTNGLTEPAIAQLFRLPDGEEKTRRFLETVLGEAPDIALLGFGPRNPDGTSTPFENEHSPFIGPTPIAVFRGYRDAGFAFACTLGAYYDLHLGVARSSPHAPDVTRAVTELCRWRGRHAGESFVVTDGRESVVFPPLGSTLSTQ